MSSISYTTANEVYQSLPATSKELQKTFNISSKAVRRRIFEMRKIGFVVETVWLSEHNPIYNPISKPSKKSIDTQTYSKTVFRKVLVQFPDMGDPMGMSLEEYHKTQKYIHDNGGVVTIGDKRVEAYQPEIGL